MKQWSIALLCILPTFGLASDAEKLPGIWAVPADDPVYKVALNATDSGNGLLLEGIIVETYPDAPETCRRCRGEMRGQPLVGMTILEDTYLQGASWGGGTMLDPITGREWSATFIISIDQASVDIALKNERLGTTINQTWSRLED